MTDRSRTWLHENYENVIIYFATFAHTLVSEKTAEDFVQTRNGMSATKLDIEWKQPDLQGEFSTPVRMVSTPAQRPDPKAYTRQLVSTGLSPGAAHCPQCESIVYSRRSKLCGVCNAPLPQELLFNSTEAERIVRLLKQERQRHKRWMHRVGQVL